MEEPKEVIDDDFVFYSLLYSSITVVFALAVLSKFLTNECRFGIRSVLSLVILFIGEPMCHFLLRGPTGVAAFGMGCFFVYSILPASHLPAEDKTVLITGCDSGFGHSLAKKLDSIGMRVYAGCLYQNGPGAADLQHSCSNKLKVLQLDVTSPNEIFQAEETIKAELGSKGLWGLVNNAGVAYAAECELTSDKLLRRIMDVNFFGMASVTKAFLPLVRQAHGRIVNMSSVTGKVAFDCYGAYSASKHAIEAYTDALRMEMSKWGVHVSLVQPAGFLTAGMSSQALRDKREEVWNTLDGAARTTYGYDYIEKIYSNVELQCSKYSTDFTPVVRVVRAGLLSRCPQERYVTGRGAGMFIFLYPLFPSWLSDRIIPTLGGLVKDATPLMLR